MNDNDIFPTNADEFFSKLVDEADQLPNYINANQIDTRNFLSLRIFSAKLKDEMEHKTLQEKALEGKQLLMPSFYYCYMPANVSENSKHKLPSPKALQPVEQNKKSQCCKLFWDQETYTKIVKRWERRQSLSEIYGKLKCKLIMMETSTEILVWITDYVRYNEANSLLTSCCTVPRLCKKSWYTSWGTLQRKTIEIIP